MTPDGLLLDAVADKSISAAPEAKCVRPGSLWGEQYSGHADASGTATPLGRWTRAISCCFGPWRRPSRREETEMLKDYIAELKEELQDAEERLKDLEK